MTADRRPSEQHIHFVGVGGIGMSGIAQVLRNQGYQVSGSDLAESESTRALAACGVKVFLGHRAEHVQGAHVVVISSAVRADNPEVLEAHRMRIPVIPRAEMLGELMRGKQGIAVGGTHGKTTTTSMLATIFTVAGLDPTLVIGGKVDSFGGNAKLGKSEWVVAEADESDGSFLHLPATYAVVTNIDNDHLDHFGTMEAVDEAFTQFVNHIPFYGLAAVCGDDPGVQRVIKRFRKPYVTYGQSPDRDWWFTDLSNREGKQVFTVHSRKRGKLGQIELWVPGKHNALNALAAIALADGAGIEWGKIREGLGEFRGVKRRFETRFEDSKRRRRIVDDYGHHPTEIRATLAAAKSAWQGRVVVVFQPHRYSRTLHCQKDFEAAFGDADMLILTDIYAAGEDPIAGVTGERLFEAIRKHARAPKQTLFAGSLDQASQMALSLFTDGDLLLCMGAGSITKLPAMMTAQIAGAKA